MYCSGDHSEDKLSRPLLHIAILFGLSGSLCLFRVITCSQGLYCSIFFLDSYVKLILPYSMDMYYKVHHLPRGGQ